MDETDAFPQSGPWPDGGPYEDPDLEWQEYLAWLDREIADGRDREPELWASEMTPAEPMGSDGMAADGVEPGCRAFVRPAFWQEDEADQLPPGPLLAGLT